LIPRFGTLSERHARTAFSNMKIKTILLHSLFLLAAAFTLRAADVVLKDAPKESPLFVTGKDFESMDDRIFPLGWSADGRFAWICKQSNEAADECNWVVTIQDMATNKTVATEKFELPDKPENGIARFWSAHGKATAALLATHAVKRTASVMDHFPIVIGRHRSLFMLPVIESVMGTHEDLQFGGVKSFQVFQSSADRKVPIFQRKYDGYLFPFNVAIAGCFVSPDETRVAIVITACWRGYEGAPHPRKIEALAGFKTGIGD